MANSPPDDLPRTDAEILRFPAAVKPAHLASDQKQPAEADPDDVPPLSNRALLGIALLVVFLVVSGVWLMDTMRENGIREDCVMQGRRNCMTIPAPDRGR